MDPIAIIMTIAACIGGLVMLYLICALVMFTIASKQAKKFMDDDEPFNRFDRMNRRF